jgi:hypothetical protein
LQSTTIIVMGALRPLWKEKSSRRHSNFDFGTVASIFSDCHTLTSSSLCARPLPPLSSAGYINNFGSKTLIFEFCLNVHRSKLRVHSNVTFASGPLVASNLFEPLFLIPNSKFCFSLEIRSSCTTITVSSTLCSHLEMRRFTKTDLQSSSAHAHLLPAIQFKTGSNWNGGRFRIELSTTTSTISNERRSRHFTDQLKRDSTAQITINRITSLFIRRRALFSLLSPLHQF